MVQNKKSYNLVIGVLALLTIILLIAVGIQMVRKRSK